MESPLCPTRAGRYFEHADGTPFLWIGDTWWNWTKRGIQFGSFQKLADDRAAKGFTVGQVFFSPNGLLNRAYDSPNLEQIRKVEAMIAYANSKGITVWIHPWWSRERLNERVSQEQMRRWWRYVIARLGAYNVIWTLAGEYNMNNYGGFGLPFWKDLGVMVKNEDPYRRLVSAHPTPPGWSGGGDAPQWSTGEVLHSEPWLDYNQSQVGHARWRNEMIPLVIAADYARQPAKPTVVTEPWYEFIAGNPPAMDIRYGAWTALLSGAAGHSYGGGQVWWAHLPESPAGQGSWPLEKSFATNTLDYPGDLYVLYVRYGGRLKVDLRPSQATDRFEYTWFDLEQSKERTRDNQITENWLHHYGLDYPSAVGVPLMSTEGNTLAYNHNHKCGYTGISIGWAWGYRRSVSQNNRIEYNYIHDVDANHYGGWGICQDEGSTHLPVENNLVHRPKFAPYNIHFAKEVTVRNNIFALGKLEQVSRTRNEEKRPCQQRCAGDTWMLVLRAIGGNPASKGCVCQAPKSRQRECLPPRSQEIRCIAVGRWPGILGLLTWLGLKMGPTASGGYMRKAASSFFVFTDVAVWAPLCEELACRGLLYTSLRTRCGITSSTALTAAIFTSLHNPGTLVEIGGHFFPAALFSLWYERTRSLWPNVIAHALHNGIPALYLVATRTRPSSCQRNGSSTCAGLPRKSLGVGWRFHGPV